MVVLDPTSVNYYPSATDDNGTCQYEGNVTFWYNSNGSSATVTVGGKKGLLNIIRHTTQVAVQLVVLILLYQLTHILMLHLQLGVHGTVP